MKITAITQQKRNQENVNLFLDDKFWISLSKNQLIEFGIHRGLEIGEEQKKLFEEASGVNKLMEKVMNFLSLRPRSENEVFVYLTLRRGVEDDLAQGLIQNLKQRDLINDKSFTRWFVENRSASGFHGVRKIRDELIQKKVSSKIIDEVLAEFTQSPEFKKQEEERIKSYILKIKDKIKAKNEWEKKQKIMARLMARGYDVSGVDISAVV